MIRTILVLEALPERAADIVELYNAKDILQYSLDNSDAVASEISVATDGSNEVLVTALWPDAAAYDGWLNHPNREKTAPGLHAMLRDGTVGAGRIFEIDHAVSK